jgi:hypothetical protein
MPRDDPILPPAPGRPTRECPLSEPHALDDPCVVARDESGHLSDFRETHGLRVCFTQRGGTLHPVGQTPALRCERAEPRSHRSIHRVDPNWRTRPIRTIRI